MHILCVSHSYPRFDGDVAGAFVERLNVALHKRDHLVKVIVPSDRGDALSERRHGVGVSGVRYAPKLMETLAYAGDMHERARTPFGALSATSLMVSQAQAIGRLNRIEGIDIVHAHWWVPGGVSAWLGRRMFGRRPYVLTLHGTDVALLERSAVARSLARRVLHGAAVLTTVSSYLADRVAEHTDIPDTEILVRPMPIDIDRFTETSRGGGGIVAVGRLTDQKNLAVVLEALALLKAGGRTPKLKIIGDGPRREQLEMRAQGLQVADQVTFAGLVAPDAVPKAIGHADVMVFPAVNEGLGLAAAEALLLGIPVIATRAGGGLTDIVPPTGAGRLVAPGDAAALAKGLEEFLEEGPNSRRMAAEVGVQLRKRLGPDTVAAFFEGVYERALKKRA